MLADVGSTRGSIIRGVVFLTVNAAFVWWTLDGTVEAI